MFHKKVQARCTCPALHFPTSSLTTDFLSATWTCGRPSRAPLYMRKCRLSNLEVSNPIAINLTAAFGAGNEPTAAEMDAILAKFPNSWFDGTVEVAPTLVDLIDLAGDGRTTETVKGNADEIAAIKDRAPKYTACHLPVQTQPVCARTMLLAWSPTSAWMIRPWTIILTTSHFSSALGVWCITTRNGRAQVMAYEGEPGFSLSGAVFPTSHGKKPRYFTSKNHFIGTATLAGRK